MSAKRKALLAANPIEAANNDYKKRLRSSSSSLVAVDKKDTKTVAKSSKNTKKNVASASASASAAAAAADDDDADDEDDEDAIDKKDIKIKPSKSIKVARATAAAAAAAAAALSSTETDEDDGDGDEVVPKVDAEWELKWAGVCTFREFQQLTIRALTLGSGLRTPTAELCEKNSVLCPSCNDVRPELLKVNALGLVSVEYWPGTKRFSTDDKNTWLRSFCNHKEADDSCDYCSLLVLKSYDVPTSTEHKEWLSGFIPKDKWLKLNTELVKQGFLTSLFDEKDQSESENPFHTHTRKWSTLETDPDQQSSFTGMCFCPCKTRAMLDGYKNQLSPEFYKSLIDNNALISIFHPEFNQNGILLAVQQILAA